MRTVVERLQTGADLKASLSSLISTHKIKAGVLLSLVGSLTDAALRTAGSDSALNIKGPLEIVSGTGTLAHTGTMHVHLSVADKTGHVLGGHLLDGCLVHTTAEIVIGDLTSEWLFERKIDESTSYLELAASKVLS